MLNEKLEMPQDRLKLYMQAKARELMFDEDGKRNNKDINTIAQELAKDLGINKEVLTKIDEGNYKCKTPQEKAFYKSILPQKRDYFKSANAYRIIANALALGPNKEYYFCIKKASLKNFYCFLIDNGYENIIGSKKQPFSYFDRVVKTLAMYAMNKMRAFTDEKYVYIVKADLEKFYKDGRYLEGYFYQRSKYPNRVGYKYFKSQFEDQSGKFSTDYTLLAPCDELAEVEYEMVEVEEFNSSIESYKDYYVLTDNQKANDLFIINIVNNDKLKSITFDEFISQLNN